MHKLSQKIITLSLALVFAGFLTACQKEKGPAEKAGKAMDENMKQMSEQLEQTQSEAEKQLQEMQGDN